ASWAELVLPDVPPPREPVATDVRDGVANRIARTPAVSRAAVAPRAPTVSAIPPRPPVLAAGGFDARYFFRQAVVFPGLRMGAGVPVGSRTPLRLRLDAGIWGGRASDLRGEFDGLLATGR